MPDDLVKFVEHLLNSLFGANFIQPMLLMGMALYALHRGVKNIMQWAEDKVLEPYIRPFVRKLEDTVTLQAQHTTILADHEVRIHDNELDIALLQGKVLGGIPKLDDA